jgi:hypothetical protein
MTNPLYKIQEEGTNGWSDICKPSSKEECMKQYDSLISEGINPIRLKVIKVQ